MHQTTQQLFEGNHRAISRLISLVERGDPRAGAVMKEVYPRCGRAYCIGITGPPGVGKSTLVDCLTGVMRGEGLSVGIIAVDPTSPYSGGAFLGDRIRMQRHYLDPGVFIRSIATRRASGGLPGVVKAAVRLLDASGKDMVMVETVGVGQTELGVMDVADTVVVALMPESGDTIQTLKAGLMEVADIYVVNKADREGSDRMAGAITSMLNMAITASDWTPPVVTTQAHKNIGVDELYAHIQRHKGFMEGDSRLERRRGERRGQEFLESIQVEVGRRLKELMATDSEFRRILESIESGAAEPYSSALELLDGDLFALVRRPTDISNVE